MSSYALTLSPHFLQVDVDYVQVSQLDTDAILDPTVVEPEKTAEHIPAQHKPSIDPDAVKDAHQGYVLSQGVCMHAREYLILFNFT